MVRYCVLAVALLCMTSTVFAHGTSQHVLGTVTAIDVKHIEVKTNKGAIVSIGLTKQTRFREKGHPKSTLTPAVGDRVVIEATRDEKDAKVLTATEVHFSPGKQAPAAVGQ